MSAYIYWYMVSNHWLECYRIRAIWLNGLLGKSWDGLNEWIPFRLFQVLEYHVADEGIENIENNESNENIDNIFNIEDVENIENTENDNQESLTDVTDEECTCGVQPTQ